MDCEHWQANIVRAAELARVGDGFSLHAIAMQLADGDTARESLIAHGYGGEDDTLAACVANVIEGKGEANDSLV